MTQFNDDFGAFIASRDEDEGLFSRDVDGQLVRLDSPTEGDYGKQITLQIDGKPITVPLAEPLKDAQGNVVLDIDGKTTPRYTTIYDAAMKLYGGEKPPEIPILCHQPHMQPVAVCRMCVVQIYGQKRGKRSPERKLLPACQHQVKRDMEVFTMKAEGPDGERAAQSRQRDDRTAHRGSLEGCAGACAKGIVGVQRTETGFGSVRTRSGQIQILTGRSENPRDQDQPHHARRITGRNDRPIFAGLGGRSQRLHPLRAPHAPVTR